MPPTREAGADSELIVIPGAPHAFDLPALLRWGAANPASTFVRLTRPLARLLPSTTLRGRPPKGSEVFMQPTLAFLAKHLA